jgi:ATP-dependent DNA ligase
LRALIKPGEQVALSEVSDRTAAEMLKFVKSHGLEGVVAKRSDSVYQPGQRTGLWSKYRINLGQEFVIGGYVPSHLGVDALVVGFYRGKDLIYAARVRAVFWLRSTRTRPEVVHLFLMCDFAHSPQSQKNLLGKDFIANAPSSGRN